MQLLFGMRLISSVVKVSFNVCSFWWDGCCPCQAWCPLLLPDTQLKLLLKTPWASKIWNLQWTSAVFNENEFKASFPFWITDTSSTFPVQPQGCSCALGEGLRFLLGAAAGAGLGARGCSCSTALSTGGWVETRETPVERKGQVTKTTLKVKEKKSFFQTCENICQNFCWTSPLLSYFSLCCCLGFIIYFCFCSLSYLDCLWLKIPACLQCEGCLFFKHLHVDHSVAWYFSGLFS